MEKRLRHARSCGWRTEQHLAGSKRGVLVDVLDVLDFFEKMKYQAVPTFLPGGQVREDEVACLSRTVEVGDASDGDSSQDRVDRRPGSFGLRDRANGFQRGIEKEAGVISKRNFSFARAVGRI